MTPKSYTVKKYSVQCVKEPDFAGKNIRIFSRKDASEFTRQYLQDFGQEYFLAIGLDNANRIIGYVVESGATNQCVVYPDKIFRFLLNSFSTCLVLAHNHPGGTLQPSQADINLTKKIYQGCSIFGLNLIDHIIIADGIEVSLRELPCWNEITQK